MREIPFRQCITGNDLHIPFFHPLSITLYVLQVFSTHKGSGYARLLFTQNSRVQSMTVQVLFQTGVDTLNGIILNPWLRKSTLSLRSPHPSRKQRVLVQVFRLLIETSPHKQIQSLMYKTQPAVECRAHRPTGNGAGLENVFCALATQRQPAFANNYENWLWGCETKAMGGDGGCSQKRTGKAAEPCISDSRSPSNKRLPSLQQANYVVIMRICKNALTQ